MSRRLLDFGPKPRWVGWWRLVGTVVSAGLAALVLAISVSNAFAQAPDENKIGPFYDAESKSYFELRAYSSIRPPGRTWANLGAQVKKLTFKGVRGRLAIIRSRETHDFVQREILKKTDKHVTAVWIGLRLFCRGMKLMWVDGHVRRRGDFAVWNRQWFRNKDITCMTSNFQYMPVSYGQSGSNWRWQASGPIKNFPHVLVEYPTGEE